MKYSSKGPGAGLLSVRERTVVLMAAKGKNDTAIAEELGISPGTLATYWARVRFKTGMGSRCSIAVSVSQEQSMKVVRDLADVVLREIADHPANSNNATTSLMALEFPLGLIAEGEGIVFANQSWTDCLGSELGRIQIVYPLEVPLDVLIARVVRQKKVEKVRARAKASEMNDTEFMCWPVSGLPGYVAMLGT